MLRCPPSRISLTPSDLNGLDERLAARNSARLARQRASNVRLTRGPQRSTSLSLVSAEHNVGRKRARSSVSEASSHDDGNSYAEVEATQNFGHYEASVLLEAVSSSPPEDISKEGHAADDPVRSLENVTHRQSPLRSDRRPRSVDPSSPGAGYAQAHSKNAFQTQAADSLDGILEHPLEYSFLDQTPRMPSNRRSRPVLGDVRGDFNPGAEVDRHTIEPPRGQRLLSSARARRWRVRSQDFQVASCPEESPSVNSHRAAYQDGLRIRGIGGAAPPVPEVIIHDEDSNMVQQPTLDPAAPAFVPRTCFGSVTRSFLDSGVPPFVSHHWGSLDSTRYASNLRIRSTSEQNIDVQNPRPYRYSQLSGGTSARRLPSPTTDLYMEQQRSITGFNQGVATAAQAAWDLDRYPILRTSPSTVYQPGADGLLAPSASVNADAVRSQYTPSPTSQAVLGQGHRQSHFRIYPALMDKTVDPGSFPPRTRSASPAVSTISRSTPNLLAMPRSAPRIGSRGNSWSWSQSHSRLHSQARVSSMVSAASGISGDEPRRHSSRQELDAAEEFIRRRNSPLDELTERFSRMRSVGHSWGRPSGGHGRPSLLNGDPFGQGSSTNSSQTQSNAALTSRPLSMPAQDTAQDEEDTTDADPVALSLALLPSSPLPSGAQIVPSSPPLPGSLSTSPRQPLSQLSPTKACDLSTSPIVRKPLPRTAATPKIDVYDDSQPPHTQPQTPADVTRSKRTKPEPLSRGQQSPTTTTRAITHSPPNESAYQGTRHTNSSATTFQASGHAGISPPVTFDATVVTSLSGPNTRGRARARTRAQSNSEQTENEMEAQLSGLEGDRQTWLHRHGIGTLDVTPPKEGRYERYLS